MFERAEDLRVLGRALAPEPSADQLPDPLYEGPYDPRAPEFAELVDTIDKAYTAARAAREARFWQRQVKREGAAAQRYIDDCRSAGTLAIAQQWAPHVDLWRAEVQQSTEQ